MEFSNDPSCGDEIQPNCDVTHRMLSIPSETLRQLIEELPEQIALLDDDCRIFAANSAWIRAVEEHGHSDAMPGNNYRAFCARKAVEGYEPAIEALAALDDILSGKRSYWQLIYNGRDNWRERDYQISFRRICFGDRSFLSVTRFDLTEILQLRGVRNGLTASLMAGQAVERRRMGRELHDSTAQLLTALNLTLVRLRQCCEQPEVLTLVQEMDELLGEAHREIRSISFLAHPPSLEKLGLPEALEVLVQGFARRTGLEVSYELRGEPRRMSKAARLALYRLAQEALSNTHRHARATRVCLQLNCREFVTHLCFQDNGIGMSATGNGSGRCDGVGLASMQSRLRDVGGRLIIRRSGPGTAITASVPVASSGPVDPSDIVDVSEGRCRSVRVKRSGAGC